MTRSKLKVWLAVCLLLLTACESPSDERAGWLRSTLIEDNRSLLERNPELTAGKFRKMSARLYAYFRGTAPQYWRDLSTPGPWKLPTSFGSVESSQVILVGDPHPENVGSFLPADATLTVDFNDFDATRRGPYHFDLRRLALGFWIAGAENDFDVSQREMLADAVTRGYVDAFLQSDSVAKFRVTRESGHGPVIEDLLRRADRDGKIREELEEYTRVEAGIRSVYIGQVESPETPGVIADEMISISEDERRFITARLKDYRATLVNPPPASNLEPIGMARRLGAGVSSYPVLRYYVVTPGPSDSLDDDVLLELKEIADVPPMTEPAWLPRREHSNNAERVVLHQRAVQARDDLDPFLGWAADGNHAFRIRHRTKYQKNISVERLGRKLGDDWTFDELVDFAHLTGRLLAATHARGQQLDGTPSEGALRSVVQPGLVAETNNFVSRYAPQIIKDYKVFQDSLLEHGTTLGYEALR